MEVQSAEDGAYADTELHERLASLESLITLMQDERLGSFEDAFAEKVLTARSKYRRELDEHLVRISTRIAGDLRVLDPLLLTGRDRAQHYLIAVTRPSAAEKRLLRAWLPCLEAREAESRRAVSALENSLKRIEGWLCRLPHSRLPEALIEARGRLNALSEFWEGKLATETMLVISLKSLLEKSADG